MVSCVPETTDSACMIQLCAQGFHWAVRCLERWIVTYPSLVCVMLHFTYFSELRPAVNFTNTWKSLKNLGSQFSILLKMLPSCLSISDYFSLLSVVSLVLKFCESVFKCLVYCLWVCSSERSVFFCGISRQFGTRIFVFFQLTLFRELSLTYFIDKTIVNHWIFEKK